MEGDCGIEGDVELRGASREGGEKPTSDGRESKTTSKRDGPSNGAGRVRGKERIESELHWCVRSEEVASKARMCDASREIA